MKQSVKSWISANEIIAGNREYENYCEQFSAYEERLRLFKEERDRKLAIREERLKLQRARLKATNEAKKAQINSLLNNIEQERSA